jgi:hypothetical protein
MGTAKLDPEANFSGAQPYIEGGRRFERPADMGWILC